MMGEMDHTEVRAILEDAAIEPDGLDRLMAGDTPTAALIASHLAGCPDCAEELSRLHRSVDLIRPSLRAVPPPELRERTLAYVAAVGRPRGATAEPVPAAANGAARSVVPAAVTVMPLARPRPANRRRLATYAAMAAALIVAVSGTAFIVNANRDPAIRTLSAEVEALGDVARWTARIDAQPDGRRVALASVDGSSAAGSLVYSAASTEFVVIADGLIPQPGKEFRCWVEVAGTRTTVGRMFFGGTLAYWVGDVKSIAGLAPGATFGVSLVDLGQPGTPGTPVLAGGS